MRTMDSDREFSVVFAVLLAAQSLTQIAPQTVVISKAAAAADQLFKVIDRESKIDSLSDDGIKPLQACWSKPVSRLARRLHGSCRRTT